MKRRFALGFISVLLFIIPLCSAADLARDLGAGAQRAIEIFESFVRPFASAVLGDYASNTGGFSPGEFLFIRVLILILLYLVISTVLRKAPIARDRFGENGGITFLISIIIAVIAVRYMSREGILLGILLPYGVLGTAILMILPFLIFFFFIHFSGLQGPGRRISWIFFSIIFIVFWLNRTSQFSQIENQIFTFMIIAIVILFIFDKQIHAYFRLAELKRFTGAANERVIAGLQAEYLEILHVDTEQARRRREAIKKQLKELKADLP